MSLLRQRRGTTRPVSTARAICGRWRPHPPASGPNRRAREVFGDHDHAPAASRVQAGNIRLSHFPHPKRVAAENARPQVTARGRIGRLHHIQRRTQIQIKADCGQFGPQNRTDPFSVLGLPGGTDRHLIRQGRHPAQYLVIGHAIPFL
ncbi:MAG: hypothetical protein MZV64_17805 [Ignavibacteriales bacterium]|nr:hypothetical protein [Ignavibacteriales bacterium]